MAENERLLTDTDAELAWHFAPENGNSFYSDWVSDSRVHLSARDLCLIKAQAAKTRTATAQEMIKLLKVEVKKSTIILIDGWAVSHPYQTLLRRYPVAKTKIEWCINPDGSQGITLNPIKGMCPMACPYCYARRMYKRFGWKATPEYHPSVLTQLYTLKKPTGIFLCSTFEWLWNKQWAKYILGWIKKFPQHRFYLLTKRPYDLAELSPYPDNCWVGVSAWDSDSFDRNFRPLLTIKAKVKFISIEPLLNWTHTEGLEHPLSKLDWVIIGSQTPHSEKTAPHIEWVKEIVEAADKANIPVFLKNNLNKLVQEKADLETLSMLVDKSLPRKSYLRHEFPIQ